jgi:uncharacterized protein (TIGR02569 family)
VSGPPPRPVVEAYGGRGVAAALTGGEGHSWRVGDLVLKPWEDGAEWAWLGEHLPTVREEGFRLALPVPASDGRWVVDGWCAQTWVAGSHPAEPRWTDVLSTCDRVQLAFAHLPRPTFVDTRTHPWSVGDRVAWGEADPPVQHPFLVRLLDMRRAIDLRPQVIHGDLTENVLFADPMPPAVIDPTLYWRPAGYANAIVVGDAVRWAEADPAALVAATAHIQAFPQLLVRAVIARLVTTLVFDRREVAYFEGDVRLAVELAG